MAEPHSERNTDAGPRPVAEAHRLLRALADLQFREMVTPRMLPTIYGAGLVLAALLTLYLVAVAFRDSWGEGMAWLLLLGPAVFISLVGALRIGLEFLLAIFRIALHVERVDDIAHRIHGQTEEIAEDLPRIQFWRALSRPRRDG